MSVYYLFKKVRHIVFIWMFIIKGYIAVQAELLLRYNFTGQDTNSFTVVNEGGTGPDALVSGHLPLYGSGISGEFNDFSFDGTGAAGVGVGYAYSGINCKAAGNSLIGPLKSFTITGWFKADHRLRNACCLFHAKGEDGNNLGLVVTDDSVWLSVNKGGASTRAEAVRNPYDDSGSWTFFAVTYNPFKAANEVVVFYKGTSKLADTMEVITTGKDVIHRNGWAGMDKSGLLTFGATISGNQPVDALLDDVRFYANSVDASGALSFEELDAVRKTKDLIECKETASSRILSCQQSSDFSLPSIFSDHMVLQRERMVPVWGTAKAGASVLVEFAGQMKKAIADDGGKWRVNLDSMTASSEPRNMKVSVTQDSKLETRNFYDVLVGEVWYCSGQSNMDFPMKNTENATAAITMADYPLIRLFNTPRQIAGLSTDIPYAQWHVCSSETVGTFSAVAYYFGRRIFQDLNVPVGLLKSAWGGTRIEPWIPPCGYAMVDSLAELYKIALNVSKLDLSAQDSFQIPSVLHNGMVSGHIPYAIRGALWYQGESSRYDRQDYIDKTKALLNGWYKLWGYEFPFLFVQIAPFKYWDNNPKILPGFWEIQSIIARTVTNAGMVVISDAATLDNIHPPNKEIPGNRLALLAEANVYGLDVVCSGPAFQSLKKTDSRLTVTFDFAEGLATRDGQAPDWFEIAGVDGVFYPAIAKIFDNTVILYAKSVVDPVYVRFAWDEQAIPNLINGAGLPASSFRADIF